MLNDQKQLKFKDLDNAMRSLGVTPNAVEIQELGKKIENEFKRRGLIFEEFLSLMTKKLKESDSEGDLIKAFQMIDVDGSGNIETSEVIEIFKELGEGFDRQTLKEMVEKVDLDGNGKIDQSEFIQMMRSK